MAMEQLALDSNPARMARTLGWFSIGLGLAEMTAPRALARLIGVPERRGLMRAFGAREIAAGVGLLRGRRPATWMWARVMGDALDLGALGTAMRSVRTDIGRAATATAAVVGVTALDVVCARQLGRDGTREESSDHAGVGEVDGLAVEHRLAVNASPDTLYAFWRRLTNLPRFMKHLVSVEETGPRRSHWTAKGPADMRVEWDAEITADQPGQEIAWRSLEGADVDNVGSVRFERLSNGRGTVVHVSLRYRPPAGSAGAAVAKLFGKAPEQALKEDLRRFKQIVETGEVPTTEGQPAGRASGPIAAMRPFRRGAEGGAS
jgi:uncharacterized membrane protein